MAGTTEGLKVVPIPEAAQVPVMLDDMVNFKGQGDIAAEGTAVRLIAEDSGA
jgi:hypothetical protein